MVTPSRSQTAEQLIAAAGGNVEQIIPYAQRDRVAEIIRRVHPSYQQVFAEACLAGTDHLQQIVAALIMSIMVEEQMQPNAAVGLYAANPTTGAAITPGTALTINTVYPLLPYQNAALSPVQNPSGTTVSFQFVEGQRFFGVTTGIQDSAAGWAFAQGSLKFGSDAIGPMNIGDVSFALFQPQMTKGRMITGVYARKYIVQTLPFYVGAVLKNTTNTAMVEGVILEYWDDRCLDTKIVGRAFAQQFGTERFGSLVRDMLEQAGAMPGMPAEQIVQGMRANLRAMTQGEPTATPPRFS